MHDFFSRSAFKGYLPEVLFKGMMEGGGTVWLWLRGCSQEEDGRHRDREDG